MRLGVLLAFAVSSVSFFAQAPDDPGSREVSIHLDQMRGDLVLAELLKSTQYRISPEAENIAAGLVCTIQLTRRPLRQALQMALRGMRASGKHLVFREVDGRFEIEAVDAAPLPTSPKQVIGDKTVSLDLKDVTL